MNYKMILVLFFLIKTMVLFVIVKSTDFIDKMHVFPIYGLHLQDPILLLLNVC